MLARPTLTEETAAAILGEDVAALEPLPSAGIAAVAAVRTAAGRALVLKRAPAGWEWTIAKELHVYELLRPLAAVLPLARVLPTPAPDVLVLERLPGTGTHAVEDVAQLYRDTGALLAQMHRVELEAFGYIGADGIVEAHATNLDYMRVQFEQKLWQHGELGGDRALRTRIAAHVVEREALVAGCETAVLCHNDCHEGNLIVDEGGRITGLIDFQNAVAGDPLLDLAKTAYYTRRDRDVVVPALLDGYGTLRGDGPEALALYVLYHQLELWDWFAELGDREHLDAIEREMRAAVGAP